MYEHSTLNPLYEAWLKNNKNTHLYYCFYAKVIQKNQ